MLQYSINLLNERLGPEIISDDDDEFDSNMDIENGSNDSSAGMLANATSPCSDNSTQAIADQNHDVAVSSPMSSAHDGNSAGNSTVATSPHLDNAIAAIAEQTNDAATPSQISSAHDDNSADDLMVDTGSATNYRCELIQVSFLLRMRF